MPEILEYTPSHRMVAAGTRLVEAWPLANLEIGEMHDAVLGLILATGATDFQSALDLLHNRESGHGS